MKKVRSTASVQLTAAADPAPSPSAQARETIGVGIDTSRYGHYAAFLGSDLQPAADELAFAESAAGYDKLRQRLDRIASRLGPVHFQIRLDAAGQYAANLEAFLRRLPYEKTISCGDPQRNKNYRAAIYGNKKSDPIEARAAARYAVTERPAARPETPREMRLLLQIATRLESQTRQLTRLVNQLHNLLSRVFPELALVAGDLRARWVLELLARYPTPAQLARARRRSLEKIPYLDAEKIEPLQTLAGRSVGSLGDEAAAELVRDLVEQVADCRKRQKRLENQLVAAYRALPFDNQIHTILGIGDITAAVLTAKIISIDRFPTPDALVGYFGVFPIEESSGIDRAGNLRKPKRMVMSPRGSDLVRRYLWMAALTATQRNPAVRAIYERLTATEREGAAAIALGHAMRKLLHQVWGVWKSGKPFDPEHESRGRNGRAGASTGSAQHEAAGHNQGQSPERQVVTAASGESVPPAGEPLQREPSDLATPAPARRPDRCAASAGGWIEFREIRAALPIGRVLEKLGKEGLLKGRGVQRRSACPVHSHSPRDRSFSVHLGKNVFRCLDPTCAIQGDVIDLWSAVHRLTLREAAIDLIKTFQIQNGANREEATVRPTPRRLRTLHRKPDDAT